MSIKKHNRRLFYRSGPVYNPFNPGDNGAAPPAVVYDPAYQEALDYAVANSIQPPWYVADRIRESNLITALKAANVYQTADQVMFLSSYASSDWALLDLKHLSKPGLKRSNYTYTLGRGFWRRASGDNFRSNFVPSTDAVFFTTNSGSFVFVSYTDQVATITDAETLGSGGVANANGISLGPNRTSNSANIRSNTATANTGANLNFKGRYHSARTASNAHKLYKNGSALITSVQAATGLSAFEIEFLGFNQNGTVFQIAGLQECSFWMIGANWDSVQAAIDTALSTLESSDVPIFNITTGSSFPSISSYSGDVAAYLSAFNTQKTLFTGFDSRLLQFKNLGTVTTNACQSAAMAENDCIYMAPSNGTAVGKIDTTTDTVTFIGAHGAGTQKYLGSGYDPVSKKIVFAPFNATAILIIDTANSDAAIYVDTTGVIGTISGNLTGTAKWSQVCMGSDGCFYFVPFDATVWMKFNPATNAITFFDTTGVVAGLSGNLGAGSKADGGIPYGDFIYGSPSTSQDFHKFDIINQRAIKVLSKFPAGTYKYYAVELAPNGYLYWLPYFGGNIMKLNPADDTFITFGSFPSGGPTTNILGSTILPNGDILGISGGLSTTNVIVETSTDTVKFVQEPWNIFTGGGYCGCNLARNGSIYCTQFSNTKVLKLTPIKSNFSLDAKFVLSRYINKY